ncbi:hypothetical protein BV25DRAFT_967666 [Artomyces pyxidatus]|uniref:Uncharacterized protein n=1 Tax=Artomyces pyxidatus TaxID=48021 RepID=A0ACB8SWK3_9AGAM|nr:hypothetical protein BV25DRAFT_967666 [Artomyces pyxidatus]
MKCMTTLWDDMRFLAWETKAEAQGLEADGALLLLCDRILAGDDGQGCRDHGGEWVGGVLGCGRRTNGGIVGPERGVGRSPRRLAVGGKVERGKGGRKLCGWARECFWGMGRCWLMDVWLLTGVLAAFLKPAGRLSAPHRLGGREDDVRRERTTAGARRGGGQGQGNDGEGRRKSSVQPASSVLDCRLRQRRQHRTCPLAHIPLYAHIDAYIRKQSPGGSSHCPQRPRPIVLTPRPSAAVRVPRRSPTFTANSWSRRLQNLRT